MKKVPSLYQRNYETDRLIRDEVVEGCEWVLRGEGKATKKLDGTCCLIKDGILFKRYTSKKARFPEGFVPATEVDPKTGKQEGWVKVNHNDPADARHVEGFQNSSPLEDGTYELVGPKVQGNPENYSEHKLIPHGEEIIENCPRNFEALKSWLADQDIEGVVWHHPDGRMSKIKKKDFGMKR